ncbi:MAG: hypothetical protein ACKOYM_02010, partial [Actinomycetes bacterium]
MTNSNPIRNRERAPLGGRRIQRGRVVVVEAGRRVVDVVATVVVGRIDVVVDGAAVVDVDDVELVEL